MKKQIFKYLTLSLVLAFAGCETIELDLRDDPNTVSTDQLDPDLLFNSILLGFNGFYNATAGNSSFTAEVSRQYAMTGGNIYENAYAPINFNGIWNAAYSGLLIDIQTLEPIAEERELTYVLGVTSIMKGYTYMVLADLFGDVPQSEALLGNENLNPNADDDAAVYAQALQFFDTGIALLSGDQSTTAFPTNDFFYANANGSVGEASAARWVTAANTLKLRLLINARAAGGDLGVDIASSINAIISEGNIIDSPSEDFEFQYGDSRQNPNTRHPGYNTFYENDPGGQYMSNHLMWELAVEKGFDDPRLRYYFYRQDTDGTNEDAFTLDCAENTPPSHYNPVNSLYDSNIDIAFCLADIPRGYWGRDHGDNGGIPPDNEKRSAYGVYPVGGLFDEDQGMDVQNAGSDGFLGTGINPIMLSSFAYFLRAEAALTMGTTGNPRALFEQGMRDAFDKVLNFKEITSDFAASQGDVDNYIQFVLDQYDMASSNERRLDLIMKEYHIASFGNGIESYNNFRRTGFPSNMQPTLEPSPGPFYNSALYPSDFVNLNINATQKERTQTVFWDTDGTDTF